MTAAPCAAETTLANEHDGGVERARKFIKRITSRRSLQDKNIAAEKPVAALAGELPIGLRTSQLTNNPLTP